ncbi:MAG: hypothetical protein DYH20_08885 [Gammaproteobacteria bacterium PRO9]|nr:hypothetical protein [Gammaproteobacteria bacterium PRO9]
MREAMPVRRRHGMRPALAVATGVALAAVALGFVLWQSAATPAEVARIARLSGPVEVRDAAAGWQPALPGQALVSGQEVLTGATGRLALTLAHGTTLRLDTGTRLTMDDSDRVYVRRGAVYLDAGPPAGAGETDDLRIDSAFGRTHHLGTQYEVDVDASRMLVSVREGRVAVSRKGGLSRLESPFIASAGEQLSVDEAGTVQRSAVDRHGPRWAWTTAVTPPFAIENRQLPDFLRWVSRETGRDLAYASPRVESLARGIVLRGSIAGMSPDEALTAVMATTNLGYSIDDGRLLVQSSAPPATRH